MSAKKIPFKKPKTKASPEVLNEGKIAKLLSELISQTKIHKFYIDKLIIQSNELRQHVIESVERSPARMKDSIESFDACAWKVANAIEHFTAVVTGGPVNIPQNVTNLCETILQHCCTLVEHTCGKGALESPFLRSKENEDALKEYLKLSITKAIEGLKL